MPRRPHSTAQELKLRHTNRVVAAGVGGAIATVLLGIGSGFGVHPTPAEAGAFTTLCSYGAAFLPATPRQP